MFESGSLERLSQIGREKNVYHDPIDDENKAYAEFKYPKGKTQEQLKGAYYLAKIMELLHPAEFTTVHAAGKIGKDANENNRESIPHKAYLRMEKVSGHIDRSLTQDDREHLKKKYSDTGMLVDITEGNFKRSTDGIRKHLDRELPWIVDIEGKIVEMHFDPEMLLTSIQLISEDRKEQALKHYERLTALLQAEQSKTKAKE